MSYFHGTTNRRFRPGEVILPGRSIGTWSNWSPFEHIVVRPLRSGRVVRGPEVVWISTSESEAEGWAYHSTLKATAADIRAMPGGGIGVYEVEPIGLDFPTEPHGDGEACCEKATVVREVSYEAFPLDACDRCGATATVGLGTDTQLCAECAKEEG